MGDDLHHDATIFIGDDVSRIDALENEIAHYPDFIIKINNLHHIPLQDYSLELNYSLTPFEPIFISP